MSEYKSYSERLRDPRWKARRDEIEKQRNKTCECCGREGGKFHVHHGYYEYGKQPWEYEDDSLWLLCSRCHEKAGETLRDIYLEIARINPRDLRDFMSESLGDLQWRDADKHEHVRRIHGEN